MRSGSLSDNGESKTRRGKKVSQNHPPSTTLTESLGLLVNDLMFG